MKPILDLETFIAIKLHSHNHVNHIFSRCIKLLNLVRSTAFVFSAVEYMQDYILR
jgi:hypothetical protein